MHHSCFTCFYFVLRVLNVKTLSLSVPGIQAIPFLRLKKCPAPNIPRLHSSVGRASHQYHGGSGFKFRCSLKKAFRVKRKLLKLLTHCKDPFIHLIINLQFINVCLSYLHYFIAKFCCSLLVKNITYSDTSAGYFYVVVLLRCSEVLLMFANSHNRFKGKYYSALSKPKPHFHPQSHQTVKGQHLLLAVLVFSHVVDPSTPSEQHTYKR